LENAKSLKPQTILQIADAVDPDENRDL